MKKIKCLAFILLAQLGSVLSAQTGAAVLTEGVGVEQKLGKDIPHELVFSGPDGSPVKTGDLLAAGKVTILVPVYYSCPSLCSSVLNSLVDIINQMPLQLGKDYQVVCVSFDPTNTPELASAKAANYRETLVPKHQKLAETHWRFLTGTQENIGPLMDQIGFHYKKVGDEYSHAAALVFLTPDGRIARYLTGIGMSSEDSRLAILEASAGKVGSPIDLIYSYCYRYSPTAGKYVPMAWRIMRVGCLLALAAMVLAGAFLWKSELVRKRRLEHNV